MIVAMYFLMIRPQRKQQQKHQDTLSKLQKGDHVVTIGRLHGVVDEINNEAKTVTLDCDGIFLVFDLNAIGSVSQRAASSEVAAEPAKAETKPADDAAADTASTETADKPADSDETTDQDADK
ncbi:preprotein translocase subunit YajC [Secundilactobacillus paracollinoides]|uniref:Preprotein translocase subunit YajC n=2 Tax=Secundilactobacillus paracollinoides TaxID=240427 RepID=A0A1B2J2H9_9LACO|nr:preprotein translocase subunit YajC [Secundilactobacillus paracollinoides]ANZ65427.1 preprotein translocase subunit YajC [Secundilactobacillus paracollinoides]ANZ68497.1 preprotein translocase subunit YajC [Secundilactobacillus paracollinoides]